MSANAAQSMNFQAYANVLRRRRLLVVLISTGCLAAALVFSLAQTPVYEAYADVLVQADTTPSVFSGTQARPALNAIETETEVLISDPVRRDVEARLGSVPNISAGRVGETEIMRMTARSTKAATAAQIANAYADAYVDFRKKEAVGDLRVASAGIRTKITDLQAQLDSLDKRIREAPLAERASVEASLRPVYTNVLEQQSALAQKLDQLEIDADLTSGGARVVRQASAPGSPASPKPLRNGVAALVLGILLGAAVAFVRESFDDSVRNKRQLAEAIDLPVLSVIPPFGAAEADLAAELRRPNSRTGEAFRNLRTSVQLLGVERPLRTIQITSPVPREGKTTVVAALGLLLATGGQRVALVDGDLRRPRLHEVIGLDNEVGVTSVLAGELSMLDAIRRVPGADPLFVLSAGPPPPNPAELMASRRMAELVFELQEQFDLIIVDSAPVLPVTDATLLAAWVEAIILVARAGSTTVHQLRDAVDQLRQIDARLAGTVLNDAEVDATYDYYYTEPDDRRRRTRLDPARPGDRGREVAG